MQNLDPMAMPLVGANLIEASAGTGKTYTITALYLRLLLGFNQQNEVCEPLSIENILVVTFTEAATAEIKDRVRARLITLRDKLLGKETNDDVVNQLCLLIENKHQAFNLIDAAVKSLDDAAIYTIHGFCQRMLKQHAFESGMAFDLTFIMDQSELLETAIKDFWRQFVFPLAKTEYAAVTNCYDSPSAILKDLFGLLARTDIQIQPNYSFEQALAMQQSLFEKTSELKQLIIREEFIGFIENTPFKKSKPIASAKNLTLLADYCQSDDIVFQGASKRSFEIWGSESFSDASNYLKGKAPVNHTLSGQFDELAALSNEANKALPVSILLAAYQYVVKWLIDEKQKHQLINPDDLLTNLKSALIGDNSGSLASAIRNQYPVALIDEFQDTDPVQYGIFSTIYLSQEPIEVDTALIMIGDPKQAIYGFRGADIFTYIDAKHQVPVDAHYTLDTNYRSSSELVSSVNNLFSFKQDSFIFNKDIPFTKVKASQTQAGKRLMHCGNEKAGLHFSVLDELENTIAKGQGEIELAGICAEQIATLLMGAQRGETTLGDKALQASDIAILVRDRNQANSIKAALQLRGVASVFLSRESVFDTPLASHLLTFLSALLSPYNEAIFRGVLVGPLFSLDYHAVYLLTQDMHAWEDMLTRFSDLKASLHKKGVMAVIETLVETNNLPKRWHDKNWDVARMLTDIRHLGELLQQKQLELNNYHRLLNWFYDQITEFSQEGSQLRLETDQELVNIVTMHGSKGLEYPVVFIPFAASFRENSEAVYHNEKGELIYDLTPSDTTKQLADKETLAEDLRLLYVALTRAVNYLEVGLFNIKDGRKKEPGITKTPLGHLLFSDPKTIATGLDWYQQLQSFCHSFEGLSCATYSALEESTLLVQNETEVSTCTVKLKQQPVPAYWRLSSFSGLTKSQHKDANAFDYKQGADDENHQLDWLETPQNTEMTEFSFPKGANAGSCLHAIMENIDFNIPAEPVYKEKLPIADAVTAQLQHYQIDIDWENTVTHWITKTLTTQLHPLDISMADLNMDECLIEMEFMLPVSDLVTSKLNEILLHQSRDHFTPLANATVSGMLKGFIDLIFCHGGRFYVLDYKSNYLGGNGDDYNQENMESVMSSHHYHLQYLLYTVALHRMLKHRLANYDMKTHLGGSFYLFMRGMPSGHGVYYKEIDYTLIEQLDSLFERGTFDA